MARRFSAAFLGGRRSDTPTRVKRRLLICVAARDAERTVQDVLERIPRSLFDAYECGVLTIDDASRDRTGEAARRYQGAHAEVRMTLLRNERARGYGGTRKLGCIHAIREGFDYVAILGADGTYPPEELPRLMAPLRDGAADVVLGSPRAPGRPRRTARLYELAADRALTAFQNVLRGTHLGDPRAPYRAYAAAALKRVAFQSAPDDVHFDTEILLQLQAAGQRVSEVSIEASDAPRTHGPKRARYAAREVLIAIGHAMRRSGVGTARTSERIEFAPGNAYYDLKLGYASSHTYALATVPDGSRVLDIGSGPGGIARELLRKGCKIAVVDRHAPATIEPYVPVLLQDLDDPPAFVTHDYEYLLLLDVIEHLKDPERFLAQLRGGFDWSPKTLVLTTPNIAFVVQRMMLLFGQFNYGRTGILDRTHTRLFTFRSLRRLLLDAGFRLKTVRGVPAPFPKVLGDGWLGKSAVWANVALIRVSKTLFSYQIFVVAEGTPDVDFILSGASSAREGGARRPPQAPVVPPSFRREPERR